MSKAKCVHCHAESDDWNWDHVFPVSWYPANTPDNFEKWKVPSCRTCNSDYGKLEQDLLLRFAMCMDPNDEGSTGIVERALRSVSPGAGRSPRDSHARARAAQRLMEAVDLVDELPSEGVIADFHETPNFDGEKIPRVRLPRDGIHRLIHKFVKGICYIEDGTFIEDSKIRLSVTDNDGATHLIKSMARFGYKICGGPGVNVHYATTNEDEEVGLFAIEIWRQRWFFAAFGSTDENQVVHI